MLLFELRRAPEASRRLTADVAEKVLNRCVLSALEVVTRAGAEVVMAGTRTRPVVEARFEGGRAAERAARAANEVLAGVHRVQRAREYEFQVVGAITAALARRGPDGVTVTLGRADVLLHRLREAAAPGQILMSAAARRACADAVDTEALGAAPDGAVEVHLLRGIRAAAGA
jgi:class 3 adenylate cyclase